MTIHIEDLTFSVIIGLLDFEREKEQRIILNITATYNYEDENFIDYGDIVILLQTELKTKRYKLLEDALLGLKSSIYTSYPQLHTLHIKIAKPDILSECSVALSNQWVFE